MPSLSVPSILSLHPTCERCKCPNSQPILAGFYYAVRLQESAPPPAAVIHMCCDLFSQRRLCATCVMSHTSCLPFFGDKEAYHVGVSVVISIHRLWHFLTTLRHPSLLPRDLARALCYKIINSYQGRSWWAVMPQA